MSQRPPPEDDDDLVNLVFLLESLMHHLIEARRHTREDVIMALNLTANSLIASIPSKDRRNYIVKQCVLALNEDVEDLVQDQRR